MTTEGFCSRCTRAVFLEGGADLTCPVCSSPLSQTNAATELDSSRVGLEEARQALG